MKMSLFLQLGDYRYYGLDKPDYPITMSHPVLNSELLYKIRHGDVHPRKGISGVEEKHIFFKDGTVEEYDVIVAATGYKICFPFFKKNFIDYEEADRIALYLRMIHPEHPTLFLIGLLQPQGCIWPLADLQSKIIANHIMGRWKLPPNLHQLAEKEADGIARDFISAKRHTIEVHYDAFFNKLKKIIPKNAPEWEGTQLMEGTMVPEEVRD